MYRTLLFVYAALLATLPYARSQGQHRSQKTRVLFLVDASSSMNEPWQGDRSRFRQAAILLKQLMDSLYHINPGTEFALRVFGHQYPAQQQQCYDSRLEIPFSQYNTEQIDTRLNALKGYGVSPIAFALREAIADDFRDEQHYAYSMILITDGGESCGGDICQAAQQLLRGKLQLRPYIISMVDTAPLHAQYSCLGTLHTVTDTNQVRTVLAEIQTIQQKGFEFAQSGIRNRLLPVAMPVTVPARTSATIPERDDTKQNAKAKASPVPRSLIHAPGDRYSQPSLEGGIFVEDQARKIRRVMTAEELKQEYPDLHVNE